MSTAIATPRWSTLPGKPATFPELTAGNTLAAATANTAAINAASLAVSTTGAGRGTLWVPDGDWYILLSLATTYLRVRGNLTIRGQSWDSRLIVYSGSGNYQAVFWDAASTLTGFTLRNLSILQNPQGNTTADIKTQGQGAPDNTQCQFGLYVTGANAKNIRIIETNWEDCCGVNTLNVNSTGGSRVRVFGNRLSFKRGHTTGTMPAWPGPFNGAAGYDASVGYFAARDVRGSDNTVVVDDYADFNGGIEIHGVEQAWQHNTFHGCYTAFSVVPPFTAADNQSPSNVLVSQNHINRAAVAIGLQLPGQSPNTVDARGWKIDGNEITLYQAGGHHDSTESAGVRLSDNGNTASIIDGLEVTNNRVEFESDSRASSTRYGHALSTTHHGVILSQRSPMRNLSVKGNTIIGAPTTGIMLGFVATDAEMTGVDCTGNTTIDCGRNVNNAAANTNNLRCHYDVTGVCSDVKVYDNFLKDTAPGSTLNGLYGMRMGPMASPLFSYANNNRQQTSVLPLLLYVHDFGYSLCAVNAGAIANGASIPHLQSPNVRFQPAANVTGALLTAGVYHGQRVTLFNESDFTVTFAATGTYGQAGASNVAAGTNEVIGAQSCRTFVWNQIVNKFFAER